MKTLLSIVIPTLNEEKYLPLLLGDLAHQSRKDFEVIVVDGNSEDTTIQKAHDFKKKLTLHVEKVIRRNLSFQRNTGVDLAKGEYVLILDADTRIDDSFVKTVTDEIKKNRALIYLPIILPITTKLLYRIIFKISNLLVVLSQHWSRPLPTQAAMIFNRDFFISLGGYRVHNTQDNKKYFPEDHDIMQRAKKTGVQAKALQEVQVKVSQRRFDQRGALVIMFTYLISAIQMTLFGKMKNSRMDYEMGGHVYGHQ